MVSESVAARAFQMEQSDMHDTLARKPIVERVKRRCVNPREAAEAVFKKTAEKISASATSLNDNFVESTVSEIGDVSSVVMSIGPETARRMRDTMHFERQRKINQKNIDRLAHEMRNGTFIPGTQVYLCEFPDGSKVVINANHTLEAIAASGIPQIMVVTKKRVANINEAGRLYAVFDVHKARSWLDSVKATGVFEDGDSATKTSKVLAAIGCIENRYDQHGNNGSASRLGRIERIAEFEDTVELFWRATDGASSEGTRFVRRAPIMAVALTTFRYQPSLASEFWHDFAIDSGLVEGAPEKALLNYLRNNKATGGSAARKIQARAAALAWNAKFRGVTAQHVKPGAMSSFFLLGTNLAKGLEGAE